MRAESRHFLQLEDLSGCLIYKAALQLLANLEAVKRQQQWRRVRLETTLLRASLLSATEQQPSSDCSGGTQGKSPQLVFVHVCLHDLRLSLICIQYELFYKTNLSSLEEMGLITLLPWLQATSTSILILKIKHSIHRAAFMHDLIINAARRSHFL